MSEFDDLRKDLENDLQLAVEKIEQDDPYVALRGSLLSLTKLKGFDDAADAAIGKMIKTLCEGGIFSTSIEAQMERNIRILQAIEEKLRKLAGTDLTSQQREIIGRNIHELVLDSYRCKTDIIALLDEQRKRAAVLTQAMSDYFNDRKLLEFVQRFQRSAKEAKRRPQFFDGSAQFVTTSLLGSFNITRELFDILRIELNDRFERCERQYIESLRRFGDTVNNQLANHAMYNEQLQADRALLQTVIEEHRNAARIIRETAEKLRAKHRLFEDKSGEIRHFIGFLALQLKKYERDQKKASI